MATFLYWNPCSEYRRELEFHGHIDLNLKGGVMETKTNHKSRKRLFFLDNLRICLTILVILHHAAIAYGGVGDWGVISPWRISWEACIGNLSFMPPGNLFCSLPLWYSCWTSSGNVSSIAHLDWNQWQLASSLCTSSTNRFYMPWMYCSSLWRSQRA